MTQLDIQDQLKVIHQDFIAKFSQIRDENEAIKSRLKNIETKLDTDNAIRQTYGVEEELTTSQTKEDLCRESGNVPKA